MSSELSTSSWEPAPTASINTTFVPFRAWIRLIPDLGGGKRRTMIHNLQKAVRLIELSLEYAIDNNLLSQSINISTPILFTPQFGDFTARATIVGFVGISRPSVRSVHPTTDIQVIHTGVDQGEATEVVDLNRGGSLSEGQDPVSNINTEVAALRRNLNTALDQSTGSPGLPGFIEDDIIHVEYNGIKFGTKKWGGRSFP